MAVVAAAVHPAGVLRDVLEGVELVHREGVHVGTKADRPVALPAPEGPDHPGHAKSAPDRDAPCGQALRHHLRGSVLLEGELGVAVQIAADPGHLVAGGDDLVDEVHARVPRLAVAPG